jgi:hypothetical protein
VHSGYVQEIPKPSRDLTAIELWGEEERMQTNLKAVLIAPETIEQWLTEGSRRAFKVTTGLPAGAALMRIDRWDGRTFRAIFHHPSFPLADPFGEIELLDVRLQDLSLAASS